MLIEKQRLEMRRDVSQSRQDLLNNELKELKLTGENRVIEADLVEFNSDPADRMITASELSGPATLCTADKKILSRKPALNFLDA